MQPFRRSAALSLLAAVPLLLSDAALVLGAPEPARYILTDLTGRRSQANALNAQGDVAGWMETDGRWTAFLYRHETGELVDVGRLLPALQGQANVGTALNDAGVLVGLGCGTTANFRYASGQVEEILALQGTRACPLSINGQGDLAGYLVTSQGTRAMAVRDGTLEDLQSLPPLSAERGQSQATGINAAGDVVGTFRSADADRQVAFLHRKGQAELQILSPLDPSVGKAGAVAINALGQITGWSYVSPYVAHAFLAPSGGPAVDLGVGSIVSSAGQALNGHGDVVGRMNTRDPMRAMIHSGGRMRDLNELIPAGSGVVLLQAFAINDAGQIVVEGSLGTGPTRAFLLNPVGSNLPPVVDPGGPYEVGEGGTVEVRALGSDPLGEAVSFAWDLDGNGTFETPGATATFSAASLDGPTSRVITVRARDAVGLVTDASAPVSIRNVPPAAAFAVDPGSLFPGNCFTLRFSEASDPGQRDRNAGFAYAYDCEGDGTFETSTNPAHLCRTGPADPAGPRVAAGRIVDKNGGVSAYPAPVEVLTGQRAIEEILVTTIQDLVDAGLLPAGRANAFLALARAASAALDRLNPQAASNILDAFAKQVEAAVRTGLLPPEVGERLLTSTQQIASVVLGSGGGGEGCTPPPPPPEPPACPCFRVADIDSERCFVGPLTSLCPSQLEAQFGVPVVEGMGWSCEAGSQSGFFIITDYQAPPLKCASLTHLGETYEELGGSEVEGCLATLYASQLYRNAICP